MKYFETHAHPDTSLVRNKELYISNMRSVGIRKLVVAPLDNESNYLSMNIFPQNEYPDIYFAKGLHPRSAIISDFWSEEDVNKFTELFLDKRTVAVKTGLDLSIKSLQNEQIEKQLDFLKFFMDFAFLYKKSLVLHVQEAAEEILNFFEKNPIKTKTEIHCFKYDKNIMRKFIDVGVNYFGISGFVTFSENIDLQEAVRVMPLEMILLESDSPFVKVEGEKRIIGTSDRSIPIIAKKIAQIKQISEEEVAEITYKNACRFFDIYDE